MAVCSVGVKLREAESLSRSPASTQQTEQQQQQPGVVAAKAMWDGGKVRWVLAHARS